MSGLEGPMTGLNYPKGPCSVTEGLPNMAGETGGTFPRVPLILFPGWDAGGPNI